MSGVVGKGVQRGSCSTVGGPVDGLAMALRDEAFPLWAEDDFRRVDWLWGDRVA